MMGETTRRRSPGEPVKAVDLWGNEIELPLLVTREPRKPTKAEERIIDGMMFLLRPLLLVLAWIVAWAMYLVARFHRPTRDRMLRWHEEWLREHGEDGTS